MTKRIPSLLIALVSIFLGTAWAGTDTSLSITGEVIQPLSLSVSDLEMMEAAKVRLNEVYRDGSFHGVFWLQGPSLASLLDLAEVKKEESDFFKKVDLAIVVRNKQGAQVVLSWGEVFYHNPAEVILGIKAEPVMPTHASEVKPERLAQLNRPVGLPKLVVAHDFYTERCIEEVTNIEVVNIYPQLEMKKGIEIFSPQFTITGEGTKPSTVKDLASFPRIERPVAAVGEGKGFHGLETYQGVLLVHLLEPAATTPDLSSFVIASAPDGYRSLIAWGELCLSRTGQEIFVADTVNNAPLDKNGKFCLILPNDLSADRMVKAVDKIRIMTLKKEPRLYVISVGCGDSNLISLEAISAMAKVDAFVCSEDIKARYANYIGDRPVLYDPVHSIKQIAHGEEGEKLSYEEKERRLKKKNAEEAQKINALLSEGKSVAYLEYGDPGIFGSSRFIRDYFDEKLVSIVPGLSAFNASNSLLNRDVTCKGSLVISAPNGIKANETMLKAIAENGETLVVFMGLKGIKDLAATFEKYYPATTPVALVFNAGIAGKEKVVRTTLQAMQEAARKESEKWLGLIYLGPCLGDKAASH